MIRLRSFSAAAWSRFAMTTASKISPFGQHNAGRHALRLRPQNFVSRVAPGVAYRSQQASGLMSIKCVEPARVGPGAPPRAVNGDDAEPFDLRRVAPGPFPDLGEFDRRLGEPASDPAQRRRSAGDERDGMDRGALNPHYVFFSNFDVVNARALTRIELARLQ